jgi:integrase
MSRKGGIDRGITQRKGREGWWVRIHLNGRERWFKCDNKSQAKALYGRLKADARENKFFPEKYASKKEVTLRSWINRVLEGSTNRGKKNELRYSRRWSLLIGARILTEISTEDLRKLQSRMRAKLKPLPAGAARNSPQRRQWSDATINRHFSYLRHVFTLAIEDGKLARNPVSGVNFFPEQNRTRFFSDDELGKLENHLKSEDWKTVAFAIEAGLRREEQFKLRWDQIDLETGIITIPLPKGGKTRHIPISEGGLSILRSLSSFAVSPWVFPNADNPLRHRNAQSFVNHVFTPALEATSIKNACWHTLRHTAASRRIMAGVD